MVSHKNKVLAIYNNAILSAAVCEYYLTISHDNRSCVTVHLIIFKMYALLYA